MNFPHSFMIYVGFMKNQGLILMRIKQIILDSISKKPH